MYEITIEHNFENISLNSSIFFPWQRAASVILFLDKEAMISLMLVKIRQELRRAKS